MRERLSPMIAETKFRGESVLGRVRTQIRTRDLVMRVAHRLWPSKTAANLAARTMTCTRSAELWLQGRANLSADAVINLLRSDDGFAFLEELVGDAKPKWWSAFRRRVKAELLQQKIQELENELKGVRRDSDQ